MVVTAEREGNFEMSLNEGMTSHGLTDWLATVPLMFKRKVDPSVKKPVCPRSFESYKFLINSIFIVVNIITTILHYGTTTASFNYFPNLFYRA